MIQMVNLKIKLFYLFIISSLPLSRRNKITSWIWRVTRFACCDNNVQSSKNWTIYASTASCSASSADAWILDMNCKIELKV